jgi:hypothetical protein
MMIMMIMIISMVRDYVSDLRPPTCLLFIPQVIYGHGKSCCNDIDRGKLICHHSSLEIVLAESSSSKVTGTAKEIMNSLQNIVLIFGRVF